MKWICYEMKDLIKTKSIMQFLLGGFCGKIALDHNV